MGNILVCDDEPNILGTIADILKDEGHTVYKSETGFKGLNICKEKKIDVAIIDVWMPVLTGTDLLIMLKQIKPKIQVIMISGHGNIDLAVQSLKAGAFDYIEKPPSLKKLISVVNRALKHKEK